MKSTPPGKRRPSATRAFRPDPYPVDPRFLTPNPDEEAQWMDDMRLAGYGKGRRRWWE